MKRLLVTCFTLCTLILFSATAPADSAPASPTCPLRKCLACDNGLYGQDSNGCPNCDCITCNETKCADNEECRVTVVNCFRAPCPPIPTCYPKPVECAMFKCDPCKDRYTFERDDNGCQKGCTCVPMEPIVDPPPPVSCAAVSCPVGSNCEIIQPPCASGAASCPARTECVPNAEDQYPPDCPPVIAIGCVNFTRPKLCSPAKGCPVPEQRCCATYCDGAECTAASSPPVMPPVDGGQPGNPGNSSGGQSGNGGTSSSGNPGNGGQGSSSGNQGSGGQGSSGNPGQSPQDSLNKAPASRECPADRVGRTFPRDIKCNQTQTCPGNKLCCSRVGQPVCRSPNVNKAGTCPIVNRKKTVKAPTSKCDSDSECVDAKKCCEKETGGFDCVDPVTQSVQDSRCPPAEGIGICDITCQLNQPCTTFDGNTTGICCKNGCGGTVCQSV